MTVVVAEQHPVVLVLDDEPGVRETMARFLKKWGYSPIEAESIEWAAEVLRTTPVHALILDIRLPGKISGLDLLITIRTRAELASVPILMMTGSVLSPEEEFAITARHAHLFYKPEGFDTIVTFLDQLTGRDRSH